MELFESYIIQLSTVEPAALLLFLLFSIVALWVLAFILRLQLWVFILVGAAMFYFL